MSYMSRALERKRQSVVILSGDDDYVYALAAARELTGMVALLDVATRPVTTKSIWRRMTRVLIAVTMAFAVITWTFIGGWVLGNEKLQEVKMLTTSSVIFSRGDFDREIGR